MGFYYIRSENVSVRRGLVENSALKDLDPAGLSESSSFNDICRRLGHAAGNQNHPAAIVGSGDVVVVNSSSYIDIIYLTFR
jgi:hypothetical protein